MKLAKQLVVAAATAVLISPLLPASPAQAAGSHTCFSGTRTLEPDGYHLTANPCDGSGFVDVVIHIVSGSAAGTYRCRSAFSWNGYLSASGCRISS
ncbi:hypothetical protein [Sinosporangium siamense]|nr:hypothetical protein [Sinosporangium siamense]